MVLVPGLSAPFRFHGDWDSGRDGRRWGLEPGLPSAPPSLASTLQGLGISLAH